MVYAPGRRRRRDRRAGRDESGIPEGGCREEARARGSAPAFARGEKRQMRIVEGAHVMKKISYVVCVVAVLGIAGASHAQPAGITREMIATALPVEGAPLAVPGPYKVLSEPAFGSPGHVVFRPADLSAFPVKDTLPVMAWGNGGCAINSTRYGGFLSTIASHGFLVIATAAKEGEKPRQSNADDLRAALNWAETEAKRDGSPLKGKIATDKMAVMGQSCGGFLSVALGVEPRVKTIGVFNSGVQAANPNAPAGPFPTTDSLAKLHGP